MVVLSCAFPGCAYKTEDLSELPACTPLQSHAFIHAMAPAAQIDPPQRSVQESRGPTLERLQSDFGISLEQWNIFTRRWCVFKEGSGITVASASSQLFQCASRELDDSLLISDAEICTKSLADLLASTQKLAVIPTATSVLRTKLMQLHQMRDEPFRSFGARVRGKADISAFFTKCPCGEKVDYTNNMIRDTLLNGIADTDIRREVLGTTDIITTVINDIIALVESKEIARNAISSTSVVNVTGIKRQETHLPRRRTLKKEQAPCPFCKKLFNLYCEGPLGKSIKPFTSCIDFFRLRRKARRRTQPSTSPTTIQSLQNRLYL